MHELFTKVHILDGGMGTLLADNGFKFATDPLWSTRIAIDHPEAIIAAHKQFLDAGCDIIETCTYQGSILELQKQLNIPIEKCVDILHSIVKLAKDAIDQYRSEKKIDNKPLYIAGSIGCFGGTLCDGSEFTGKYMDTTPKDKIFDYYQMQAKALANAGVDVLAFETVPSLAEAEIIVQAVQCLQQPIPMWISFSCQNGNQTCYGDRFSDVVSKLCLNPKISALGINCTHPDHVTSLLRSAPFGLKPFIVYPNSGEDWQRGVGYFGRTVCSLANFAPEWVHLGAKVVGGCCRIGPMEMAEISSAIKNMQEPTSSLANLKNVKNNIN